MKLCLFFGLSLILFGCGNESSFEILEEDVIRTPEIVRNEIPVGTAPPPLLPKSLKVKGYADKEYRERKDIDILLSVDNSGSMSEYIEQVVENIEKLLLGLVQENIDYQLAIIKNTNNYTNPTFDDTFFGSPAVVKSSDPEAIEKIIKNLEDLKGFEGGGDEKPIQSIELALGNQENWVANNPDGLFRRQSKHAYIILSDANEFSSFGKDQLLLKQHFDRIITLSKGQPWQLTVIGTPEAEPCPAEYIDQWLMEQLTILSGGIMGRICDDYSTTLITAMKRIAKLASSVSIATYIPFGYNVEIGSVEVYVNGVLTSEDSTFGWQYDEDAKLVTFGDGYVFTEGDKIEVFFNAIMP